MSQANTLTGAGPTDFADGEKRIGMVKIRQADNTKLFIRHLGGSDLRLPSCGVAELIAHLSVARIGKAAASASQKLLARYIHLGETGQTLRDEDALAQAGQGILDLPLGKEVRAVGLYYKGLHLNRRGKIAFPEANRLLSQAADQGPLLFRSKALVAAGTNLYYAGDLQLASELYAEAFDMAGRCSRAALHPQFLILFQGALIKYDQGDHAGALADFEKLKPLALHIGAERPALLHSYYNNLAVSLAANGRKEEARSYCAILANSPFLQVRPEWKATCADLLATSPGEHQGVASSRAAGAPHREFCAAKVHRKSKEEASTVEGGRSRDEIAQIAHATPSPCVPDQKFNHEAVSDASEPGRSLASGECALVASGVTAQVANTSRLETGVSPRQLHLIRSATALANATAALRASAVKINVPSLRVALSRPAAVNREVETSKHCQPTDRTSRLGLATLHIPRGPPTSARLLRPTI
jgi:hypothetical protein